jgi:hypothetical protein
VCGVRWGLRCDLTGVSEIFDQLVACACEILDQQGVCKIFDQMVATKQM